ncbi:OmpH family outer membrane protein [Candidatus Calescamantes bacterium]|nr:OmpH family outer membrane protein [Candidatus Calescamantes bacterium]MCK5600004.1 OmpH family outer membrane protein [bacterium]
MKRALILFAIVGMIFTIYAGKDDLRSKIFVKVGYVDIQKIISNYILARNYQGLFDEMRNKRYSRLDPLKESLDSTLMQLKLDEPFLYGDELSRRWSQILRLRREYQIKRRSIDENLMTEESKLNEEILKNVYRAIKDIASKYGFNIILEKKEIYYSTPDVDLSDYIIEKLNSDYITLHPEEFQDPEEENAEEDSTPAGGVE